MLYLATLDLKLKLPSEYKTNPTFVVNGFNNLKKALMQKFTQNKNSYSHKISEKALIAYHRNPISAKLSNEINKNIKKSRTVLLKIISSLKG